MITLRRSGDRRHNRSRQRETWSVFGPHDRSDPLAAGFGALQLFEEDRVPPQFTIRRHRHRDVEMLTYVHSGAIEYENSLGDSGTLYAGDFQSMTAGIGIQHSETNPSTNRYSRVYRIGIRPDRLGLEPRHGQERFSTARRRGVLQAVASCSGSAQSLTIQQDSSVYSAILEPGHHIAHDVAQRRCVWLHVVDGEIRVDDLQLTAGDGAGIHDRANVSFIAASKAEVLLVDLASGFIESAAEGSRLG